MLDTRRQRATARADADWADRRRRGPTTPPGACCGRLAGTVGELHRLERTELADVDEIVKIRESEDERFTASATLRRGAVLRDGFEACAVPRAAPRPAWPCGGDGRFGCSGFGRRGARRPPAPLGYSCTDLVLMRCEHGTA